VGGGGVGGCGWGFLGGVGGGLGCVVCGCGGGGGGGGGGVWVWKSCKKTLLKRRMETELQSRSIDVAGKAERKNPSTSPGLFEKNSYYSKGENTEHAKSDDYVQTARSVQMKKKCHRAKTSSRTLGKQMGEKSKHTRGKRGVEARKQL